MKTMRFFIAAIAMLAVSCGGNAGRNGGNTASAQTPAQAETKAPAAKAKGGTLRVSNLAGDEASITVYKVSTVFGDWAAFNAAGGEPDDDVIAVSASASNMLSFSPTASPIALYDYNDNFSDRVFTQSGTFLVQVSAKSGDESRYFSQVAFKDGSATVDWRKGFGPAHDPE